MMVFKFLGSFYSTVKNLKIAQEVRSMRFPNMKFYQSKILRIIFSRLLLQVIEQKTGIITKNIFSGLKWCMPNWPCIFFPFWEVFARLSKKGSVFLKKIGSLYPMSKKLVCFFLHIFQINSWVHLDSML